MDKCTKGLPGRAPQQSLRRWLPRVLLAGLALALGAPVQGQSFAPPPYAMNVYTRLGAKVPHDRWIPVEFELHNNTNGAADGALTVPVPDQAGGMVVRVPVAVPAHSRVRTGGFVCFAAPTSAETSAQFPALMCTWVSTGGARLAMKELWLQPLVSQSAAENADSVMLLVLVEDSGAAGEDTDIERVRTDLAEVCGRTVAAVGMSARHAPRQASGYDAFALVVLDRLNADMLDAAQRRALLDHVRSGGVLIVVPPAPRETTTSPVENWLAPHLPVEVVGWREAAELPLTDASDHGMRLKLARTVPICEALAREDVGVQVSLRDGGQYVYAASRRAGLGQVIFMAFPADAMSGPDEQSAMAWRRIVGAGAGSALSSAARPDWRGTQLGVQQQRFLQEMLGRPTTPLAVAAGIIGGYLALVLAAQWLFRAARRPRAFALTTAAALAISMSLVGLTMLKRLESPLMGARVAVVDVGRDGGGVQRETFAYAGKDEPGLALDAAGEDVALRPVVSTEDEPPVLQLNPARVPNAGVWAQRVRRVWQASRPVSGAPVLRATAEFGPDGLSIMSDNRLASPVQSLLLIWDTRVFSLGDIASGPSLTQVTSGSRNVWGDYSSTSLISTQAARQRGQILRAFLTRQQASGPAIAPEEAPAPMLAGWLDDASLPWLARSSAEGHEPPALRSQAMLRAPVHIEPSAPGTRVRVDGGFVRAVMVAGHFPPPYNAATQQWAGGTNDRQWIVGFEAPPQIGRLKVRRATIDATLSAPQQTVTVRHGQCASGEPKLDPNGPVLAEWTSSIGRQTVRLECQPQDLDRQGRLWLAVEVKAAGLREPAMWDLSDFAVSYEADVVDAQ